MSIRPHFLVLGSIAVLAVACSDMSQPASPSVASSPLAVTSEAAAPAAAAIKAVAGGVERVVMLFDACDPATFNAVLGPGACTRSGGVTFQKLLELLGKNQDAGAWHFSPRVVTMKVGETLVALNTGGEVHTFTEVDEFGGGIVPALNEVTGETTVAPECRQLKPADFLPPGARSSEVEHEAEVEKYQCCIHPWMRAEVRVTEK